MLGSPASYFRKSLNLSFPAIEISTMPAGINKHKKAKKEIKKEEAKEVAKIADKKNTGPVKCKACNTLISKAAAVYMDTIRAARSEAARARRKAKKEAQVEFLASVDKEESQESHPPATPEANELC